VDGIDKKKSDKYFTSEILKTFLFEIRNEISISSITIGFQVLVIAVRKL
jgi:hypothetical protein